MKIFLMFFLCFFASSSYSGEFYKSLSLNEAFISIPAKWSVNKKMIVYLLGKSM